MSDETVPQEFWNRADEVIALANRQVKGATTGSVSSSLMYAASRFSAFHVAKSARTAEKMQRDREAAIEYFMGQFRKMFEDNLDDYWENFARYMEPGDG